MTDPLRPGTRLGPFVLGDRLGEGGMGCVWRAVGADGVVAVKTLLRAPTAVDRAALRREIAALVRLVHPGVPRVVGHDVEGPRPWIAMELVDGETLADRIGSGPGAETPATWTGDEPADVAPLPLSSETIRDPGEMLRVLGRVARVLAWVHGEGVVHRDLKPANVILRPSGLPVLVDFGLQARTGDRERLDVPVVAGTLAYMAPEQIRGEAVDGRADLYALGCILYEVLTGRPPFSGSAAAVPAAHLAAPPPALPHHVAPDLVRLVLRLLAKRPEDRFGFAEDVADALGAPQDAIAPRPHLHRSRLRGRDGDLARCVESSGTTFILGPAGCGRTRFGVELLRRRRPGEAALSASARDPGGALAALLRGLAGIAPARPGVAAALAEHATSLARLEPSLGIPAPPIERGAERARWLAAARDVAVAAGPVRCMLDDVEQADDATLSFLEYLVARPSPAVRVVALALADAPARVLGAAQDAGGAVHLAPPEPADLVGIAADLLAFAELPQPLAALVESAPSPSAVIDCVHAMAEKGRLRRVPNGWTLGGLDGVPTEASDVLRWRFANLPREALEVAGALAVLGAAATDGALEAVLGADVDAGLQELARRHLLDDAGVRLAAPRYEAAAVAALAPGRRATLAAAAARCCRDAPPALRLGWWEAAGDRSAARAAALEALAEAGAAGADEERYVRAVVRLADGAVDAARHRLALARVLALQRRTAEARAELDGAEGWLSAPEDRVEAVLVRSAVEPQLDAHARVLEMLARTPEPALRGRLHLRLSELARELGRIDEARREAEAALATTPAPAARAVQWLAFVLVEVGELDRAERLLRDAVDRASDPLLRANGLTRLASALAANRRRAEANALLLEALALFRDAGQREPEVRTLNLLGSTTPDPALAIPWYERAVALARHHALRTAPILGNLAFAYLRAGRADDAVRTVGEAIAAARSDGELGRHDLGHLAAQRAAVLLELGEVVQAVEAADDALRLLDREGDRLWLPYALAIRGEAEIGLGRSGAGWLARARAAAGTETGLQGDIAGLVDAQARFERERAGPPDPRSDGPA